MNDKELTKYVRDRFNQGMIEKLGYGLLTERQIKRLEKEQEEEPYNDFDKEK